MVFISVKISWKGIFRNFFRLGHMKYFRSVVRARNFPSTILLLVQYVDVTERNAIMLSGYILEIWELGDVLR